MKNYKIILYILIILSVVLAIISYIFLPDIVITQISINSSNVSTMPKILAILIPFGLSLGGAIGGLKGLDLKKSLILSIVGIIIYIIMLIVNCL